MAVQWKGNLEPKRIEVSQGRRHFFFEITGLGVEPGNSVNIQTSNLSIPWMVTLTYFVIAADGVVVLRPTISRIQGSDTNTIQRELEEEEEGLTKVHNQQPACLVLDGNNIWIEPNVSNGPVDIIINLVLAEGHDLRGQ